MLQKLLFTLIVSLFFAGCITKTTPPLHIYTLKQPAYLAKTEEVQKRFDNSTLLLQTPRSTREIRTKKILYATTPHEREAYLYSRWSDTPNQLVAAYLRTYLQQSGLFKAVVDETSHAKADYILESRLDDFYQQFVSPKKAFALIRGTFTLIDAKTRKVVGSRIIEIRTPAPEPDAKGGVKAFEKAMESLAQKVAIWLSKLP